MLVEPLFQLMTCVAFTVASRQEPEAVPERVYVAVGPDARQTETEQGQ